MARSQAHTRSIVETAPVRSINLATPSGEAARCRRNASHSADPSLGPHEKRWHPRNSTGHGMKVDRWQEVRWLSHHSHTGIRTFRCVLQLQRGPSLHHRDHCGKSAAVRGATWNSAIVSSRTRSVPANCRESKLTSLRLSKFHAGV
eukprot:scaffold16479_cov127-Isochrysis_galbana.AAC.2